MTKIKFTKMNGLGNDFAIIDYEEYVALPLYALDVPQANVGEVDGEVKN